MHNLPPLCSSVGKTVKMLFYLTLIFPWTLDNTFAFDYEYNQCKGDQQTLVIPHDYDKNVPDASLTENITIVWFDYKIQRLKGINEER